MNTLYKTAGLTLGLLYAGISLAHEFVPNPLRVNSSRIFVPQAGQVGTSDIIERDGREAVARVGVLAYCADIAPNAAALGLMAYQRSARDGLVDGAFNRQGQFGAQNLVDMLMYDDGIPRFRDVVLVDGDRDQPTAEELLENFDVIIAYTDRQCGIPIPRGIANQAAQALVQFVQGGGGLVLTGFAFDSQIGFGDALFRRGLSPFNKTDAGLDNRCSRPGPLTDPVTGNRVDEVPGPCPIGSCPAPCSPQFPGFPTNPDPSRAKICLDSGGNRCENTDTIPASFDPLFQPFPVTEDKACDHMLSEVDGPTISSWAVALTEADVDTTATLCFNYDINRGGGPLPFLAINADRNIVALNTYPPDAHDINKFWYQCQVGNAVQYSAGNRDKCRDERGCNRTNPPPLEPVTE
ncbi:MAG: hypothetical protein JSW45_05960 [Thiotrichales bacterium]|nr:MAG: hypothetical protein JSW45_05960 [Thiotrichales bacterium]